MSVKKVGDAWAGTCRHGGNETWVIHQATWYLAYRSLKAHQRQCLPHALLTELPEDDDWHPYTVLTRWAQMLSEPTPIGYGVARPDEWTITNAAELLDRVLHRLAQDPDQDFRLFREEMRTCRSHLEAVLHDSLAPDKGAPCPACVEAGGVDPAKVRLVRKFAHYCNDDECTERFHPVTDDFDEWHCPRNRDHWWTAAGYADLIDERKGA